MWYQIRDQDEAYQIRERLQEKQKIQNLEALNKQVSDFNYSSQLKLFLSPARRAPLQETQR